MTADNQPVTSITDDLRTAIVEAINRAQIEIRWKPGKDIEHLNKRIRFGQLPPETSLDSYETLIKDLLNQPKAEVYVYFHSNIPYPVITAGWQDQTWAVIVTMDGVLETAFRLLQPEQYIERRGLVYVGTLEEIKP